MKLGDALQERAAAQRKVGDLRTRIAATVTTNEDEAPAEDPVALLAEARSVAERLGELIRQINVTNAATIFSTADDAVSETITGALARRDVLSTRLATLEQAAKAALGGDQHGYRYGRSELRTVRHIDVGELRREIDEVSLARRTLDAHLQRLSWETELID